MSHTAYSALWAENLLSILRHPVGWTISKQRGNKWQLTRNRLVICAVIMQNICFTVTSLIVSLCHLGSSWLSVKETTCLCFRASGPSQTTSSRKKTFWGWLVSHFHRYSRLASHCQGFPVTVIWKEDFLSSSRPEGRYRSRFWLSSRSSRCCRPWRSVTGSSRSWFSCRNSCESFTLWLNVEGFREINLFPARFSVSRWCRFASVSGCSSCRWLWLRSRFSKWGSFWSRAAVMLVKRFPDKSSQVRLLLSENHSPWAFSIKLFFSTRLRSKEWTKTLGGRWISWLPVRSNVLRWGMAPSRSEGRLERLVWYSWRWFKRGTKLRCLAVMKLRFLDWMDNRVMLGYKPSAGKYVRELWRHTTYALEGRKEQVHRSGHEWVPLVW